MAKTYTPQGINDTTQYPEDLTFVAGKKDNLAFGVTIPSIATTAEVGAVTGLDDSQTQLIFCPEDNKMYVSEVGATTFALSTAALT